jgi:hypothetical protein
MDIPFYFQNSLFKKNRTSYYITEPVIDLNKNLLNLTSILTTPKLITLEKCNL